MTVAVSVSVVPDAAGDAGVTPNEVDVGVAAAEFTVYDTVLEVDAVNAVASVGVKTAVSECDPSASTALTAAEPDATVWVEPTWVAPSMNFTVPAAPDGVTVAVSVSVVPCAAGDVGVTPNDVVVGTAGDVIVNGTAVEVEPANAVGSVGWNVAVRLCDPAASDGVVIDAVPAETFADPSAVAPSLN